MNKVYNVMSFQIDYVNKDVGTLHTNRQASHIIGRENISKTLTKISLTLYINTISLLNTK